jgi:hypothetical protein
MTMPVIINSITQFVGGTDDEWLSLDSILPNKMTVIALDTGYVKRGDGTKTYAQLPVLFNINDIVDIGVQLQNKADLVHEHEITAIVGLVDALNGKAASVHSHTLAQLPEVQGALDLKASMTYVDSGLAGKASSTHTHTIANVTGLQTSLDSKLTSSSSIQLSQLPVAVQAVAPSGPGVTPRMYCYISGGM